MEYPLDNFPINDELLKNAGFINFRSRESSNLCANPCIIVLSSQFDVCRFNGLNHSLMAEFLSYQL